MNGAARSAEAVRRARRGVLMSEALTGSRAGGPVDLDGGQRLQILDILVTSIAGTYAHLPAKRAAYASDPVQALTLLRRPSGRPVRHRVQSGGQRDSHGPP